MKIQVFRRFHYSHLLIRHAHTADEQTRRGAIRRLQAFYQRALTERRARESEVKAKIEEKYSLPALLHSLALALTMIERTLPVTAALLHVH